MPNPGTPPAITVRLSLFADLRRFAPKDAEAAREFALPPGSTVAALLAAAGVPPAEELTIGINGEQGARDSRLCDGDEVVLFSPMEGG